MENIGFSESLIDQIIAKKSYICVGLDPNFSGKKCIPSYLLEESHNDYNEAIFQFNKGLIEATYKLTPVYKPQMAFYEKYGAYDALKRTIAFAQEKGSLVILDAKRNDIGNTSEAYAEAIFGDMHADATTLNAYLGSDCVFPFMKYQDKGLFLLVKTSNKSSGEFQDQYCISGHLMNMLNKIIEIDEEVKFDDEIIQKLNEKKEIIHMGQIEAFIPNYVVMARLLNQWSNNSVSAKPSKYPYTNLGAVVGATYPSQLKLIRGEIPNSIILIPGYGAQGGTAEDILFGFNEDGQGAIINSSRGINYAYATEIDGKRFSPTDFMEAARMSAELMREDINQTLKDNSLLN